MPNTFYATLTRRALWHAGKLADGMVFEERGEGSELVFTTGEEAVPEGLEEAVMKMKEGEAALVTIADPALAYGAAGHAGNVAPVPPDSAVSFEVELVAFENVSLGFGHCITMYSNV